MEQILMQTYMIPIMNSMGMEWERKCTKKFWNWKSKNKKGRVKMDITYVLDFVNLLTLGICLCVGYAMKTAFAWFPNKYIPLVALGLGCIINILINLETGINATVVLGGMISGLASTGLHEMMRNLLDKDSKNK